MLAAGSATVPDDGHAHLVDELRCINALKAMRVVPGDLLNLLREGGATGVADHRGSEGFHPGSGQPQEVTI